MKFEIWVRDKGADMDTAWSEVYDKPEVTTIEEAEKWGQETIDRFNASLRPTEQEREFISANEVDDDEKAYEEFSRHDWRKTNLVTVVNQYFGSHDTYKCGVCGITGKRFSLSGDVKRDSDYKAASFASCAKSIVLLERREQRREAKRDSDSTDA